MKNSANLFTSKLSIGVFYIALTIVFYFLNYFTPVLSDDWLYQYHLRDNTLITSMSDVISSQIFHYCNINGRVVPHVLLQIMDPLLGKSYFNVWNAILFSLFIFLLTRTCIKKKEYIAHIAISFIAVSLIILFFPGFKMCFLWMTGASNYLLTSILLLIFHNVLFSNQNKKKFYPFLFILGVICGLTHEGIILGLFAGYVVYFYYNRNQLTASRAILLSGLFLGVVILVFSPGSLHRATSTSNVTQLSMIGMIKSYIISLMSFQNLRIFFFLILSLAILYCNNKQAFRDLLKRNIIFIVALLVSFLFVWLTKFDSLRSRFGIEFYALIILLQVIESLNIHKKLGVIACIVSIYILPMGLYYTFQNSKNTQNYMNQLQKSNIVFFPESEYESSFLLNRFVLRYALPDEVQYYWNFSKKSFNNSLLARVFNKEYVCFLPVSFIDRVHTNPDSLKEFDYQTHFPFYVKEIKSDTLVKEVELEYSNDFQSVFEKIKYKKLPKTILTDEYEVITLEDKTYLFVRRSKYSDKYLTHIEVRYEDVE